MSKHKPPQDGTESLICEGKTYSGSFYVDSVDKLLDVYTSKKFLGDNLSLYVEISRKINSYTDSLVLYFIFLSDINSSFSGEVEFSHPNLNTPCYKSENPNLYVYSKTSRFYFKEKPNTVIPQFTNGFVLKFKLIEKEKTDFQNNFSSLKNKLTFPSTDPIPLNPFLTHVQFTRSSSPTIFYSSVFEFEKTKFAFALYRDEKQPRYKLNAMLSAGINLKSTLKLSISICNTSFTVEMKPTMKNPTYDTNLTDKDVESFLNKENVNILVQSDSLRIFNPVPTTPTETNNLWGSRKDTPTYASKLNPFSFAAKKEKQEEKVLDLGDRKPEKEEKEENLDKIIQNKKSTFTPASMPASSLPTPKIVEGFVGLQNQGATCYLNSAIQSFFHTPAFRRLVFQIPTTGEEDPAKCVPLALQRLFGQMTFSNSAVSTKILTTSFGWTSTMVAQQHDIQEFIRVLTDNLETKLKQSNLDKELTDIYVGKLRNYRRGINVNYVSETNEIFYDLSLPVLGCNNIEESFSKYIEVEELTGENQYNTEEFGLQDIKLGTEFVSFPSVLQIHLGRWQYSQKSGTMEKINTKFEFSDELDLTKFLAENNSDKDGKPIYKLTGVLVHSGRYGGGHYYAYLWNEEKKMWIKFNDSIVTTSTEKDAINDNFGGLSDAGIAKTHSAYMLIYVRKSDIEKIMKPVEKDQIQKHILDWLENGDKPVISKEEKQYLKVSFVRFDEMTGFGSNLIQNKPSEQIDFEIPVLNSQLYKTAFEKYKTHNLRLFECKLKPEKLLANDEAVLHSTNVLKEIVVAVEINENNNFEDPTNKFLLFPRLYKDKNLIPLEHMFIDSDSTIFNLEMFLRKREKINKPLKISVVSTDSSITTLKRSSRFSPNITNGTAFAVEIEDVEEYNYEKDENGIIDLFKFTPDSFSKFYDENNNAGYLDVYEIDNDQPQFTFKPSKVTMSIDELKYHLSRACGFEYQPQRDSLQIFKQGTDGKPSDTSINTKTYPLVKSLFSTNNDSNCRIYYNFIKDVSEAALADMVAYSVVYSEDNIHNTKSAKLILPRGRTYNDIIVEASKKFEKDLTNCQILIFSSDKLINQIVVDKSILASIYQTIRLEIPKKVTSNSSQKVDGNLTNSGQIFEQENEIGIEVTKANQQNIGILNVISKENTMKSEFICGGIIYIKEDETLAELSSRLETKVAELNNDKGSYMIKPQYAEAKIPTEKSVVLHIMRNCKSNNLVFDVSGKSKQKSTPMARATSLKIYN
ncbi:Clan CA, family C19, ubiquitin hydrolase-like cysteine peptidase [Trichomonas vaginalis G3]|uniref:Clan CA, family C19, ubiquitin hydrolase-like cysteine peptidase n=1 Tax=Trichomonas vaginalis (strain ATCC PRA-98 / G3) TaxID=412133 RepID=A2DB19_TRIV3|nr:ubiquitinyl hydrolase protein [Trichomonas vaginalis G3]EAY22349.1 Clan CA, family C19, ubiquitin hydrolase-like cysteine peptidase [Trichomonas vaginalis G3]KAI5518287.1 ubiquitinyl hydrolase protein [Trichomonas vaginalis G3]|eukprot:XP_001583335.1 Clan CA, family C19, ubiquitin hydrolase-like cysteine peptidase [Trichomonas vaginalis G3]